MIFYDFFFYDIIYDIDLQLLFESKCNPKPANLNCYLSSNHSINPESMGRV